MINLLGLEVDWMLQNLQEGEHERASYITTTRFRK